LKSDIVTVEATDIGRASGLSSERMVAGRRSVSSHDASSWVFNRMAGVYPARPAYPAALVDAIAALPRPGARIADLGAGVGHLSIPLAARGFDVTAVEPAEAMLSALRASAAAAGQPVRTLHAAAESMPLPAESIDWVVIADALHFIDAELLPLELDRVLADDGGVAIVLCAYAETPFMRAVVECMEAAAPRRPRDMGQAAVQVFATSGLRLADDRTFEDERCLDEPSLEAVLRSISYIGPAMNAERFAAFRERIRALPGPRLWARTFRLLSGKRR
jgi:ubiquinone/menaquinone biosynthesis C-methylase UbiE